MPRKLVLIALVVLLSAPLWAQVTSDFSFTIDPSVNIPLGP